MTVKQIFQKITLLFLVSTVLFLPGCWSGAKATFDEKEAIDVIVRESGSGTRSAFVELFGLEYREGDYLRKDLTTKKAIVTDKADAVLTNVETDNYAIGYVSISSLNEQVKVLDVDDVQPTIDNVKNGLYKLSRPFNIVKKKDNDGFGMDFISFCLSREGQKLIFESGYVPTQQQTEEFFNTQSPFSITIGGSSSVAPVMEKLKEAYEKINSHAKILIQVSDSTSGIVNTVDGTYNFGMSSRALDPQEAESLSCFTIALDGIAIIVNKNNLISSISTEQIKSVYVGEIEKWQQLSDYR